MPIISTLFVSIVILFAELTPGLAQTTGAAIPGSTNRVAFTLKNSLGYHRMFRVEGPGIAYGFTMGRRETVPCNWPVGAKLYFSSDGETVGGHILTVMADDGGKTLTTGISQPEPTAKATEKPAEHEVTVRFRNNSIRFRKVALITYKPGEAGNSTAIFTLAPYAGESRKFVVGTQVYFANDQQIVVVMSGKRLMNKPFLVVKKEDSGKVFDIFD